MKRILLLFLLLASLARGAAVDIQSLVRETQQMAHQGETLSMVWWIPVEFWEASLQQQPGMTEAMRREFVSLLDDYTVFAVLHASIGAFGGMAPRDREDILLNLELKVGDEVIHPLAKAELKPDAVNFFAMMKPMFAGMLGQFGQGMEFIAYPNRRDGVLLLDPRRQGVFTTTLFGQAFRWRLPLGSLLPARRDPKSGEEFPGNYHYNPFTGDKLVPKSE